MVQAPAQQSSTFNIIPLSQIRIDGGTQPRAGLNPETIEDYVAAMVEGAVFPSVTVYFDGENYWLADGFHRVAAAKQAAKVEIEADIKQGTRRDAVLHSVGANATHGLRRTNEDKRRAVVTLLSDQEWSHWSNREIARRCQVVEGLVRRVKAELAGLSAYSTQADSTSLAQKCGVDEQILLSAQHNLEEQPDELKVRRGGTTYNLNAKRSSKWENPGTASTEMPGKSEVSTDRSDQGTESTDQSSSRAALTLPSQTDQLAQTQSHSGSILAIRSRNAPRVLEPEESSRSEALAKSPPREARFVKSGTFWELGKHRLYCGSPNSSSFRRTLPEKVALLLAFPPDEDAWPQPPTTRTNALVSMFGRSLPDPETFYEIVDLVLQLYTYENEPLAIAWLPDPQLLLLADELECICFVADPNPLRIENTINAWRARGGIAGKVNSLRL